MNDLGKQIIGGVNKLSGVPTFYRSISEIIHILWLLIERKKKQATSYVLCGKYKSATLSPSLSMTKCQDS